MSTSSTLSMSSVDFLSCSLVRMSAHGALYSAYASSFLSLECLHTSTRIGCVFYEWVTGVRALRPVEPLLTTLWTSGKVQRNGLEGYNDGPEDLKDYQSRAGRMCPDALHSLRSLLCTATKAIPNYILVSHHLPHTDFKKLSQNTYKNFEPWTFKPLKNKNKIWQCLYKS